MKENARIAVLIPCYNEAVAIGSVIADFKKVLPNAMIYVYDNHSTDHTREIAAKAGALVQSVLKQGKGNVVWRMFADIDADIYVLVDGDNTYDAASVTDMIQRLMRKDLDMVVGARQSTDEKYRFGHHLGNKMLTHIVRRIFHGSFQDMLSGYRVFSRRYVKSFPALSSGFEIETELTIHALDLGIPIEEIATPYKSRPKGSLSKLHTYRDGWRVLKMIFALYQAERPLAFFSLLFLILSGTGIVLGIPIIQTFLETGLVPRFPTAILSTGLMILAFLSLVCGLVLDTVTRGRREMKRLFYLSGKTFQ